MVNDMQVHEVSQKEERKLLEIVDIHLKTFEGFFLTFMGRGFLYHMYLSYCEDANSNLLVAVDENNKIIGFVAYSEDMSGLYKHMIKRHLIAFAWYSVGAFLRKPKVFMRLVRAFLKPSESKREECYVELSSIGVEPGVKSKGVGTQLIDAVKSRVDFTKNEYISLETDAVSNDAVNCFYMKNGFELVREYETREGRKMNEYRYVQKP